PHHHELHRGLSEGSESRARHRFHQADDRRKAALSQIADREQRRLAWRCRRGMKELDLLLSAWLQQHWVDASADERAAFECFLDLPDPLIAAYVLGRDVPPEPALRSLVDRLRARI